MKWLVLLALVGLASCRTALIGGNKARDVTIYYTYEDQFGKDVDMEYEADRLDLSLLQAAPKPTTKAAPAPAPAPKAAPTPAPAPRAAPTPTPLLAAAPVMAASPMFLQMIPAVQFMPVATYAVQSTLMQQAAQAPVPAPAPAPAAPLSADPLMLAITPAKAPASAPAAPLSSDPLMQTTTPVKAPAPAPAVPLAADPLMQAISPITGPASATRYSDDDSEEQVSLKPQAPLRTAAPAAKPRSAIPLAKSLPASRLLATVRKSLATMDAAAPKPTARKAKESDEDSSGN